MAKVKVRRSGKGLQEIFKQIQQLNKTQIEVGHFEEQGTHYSDYTFPELMYFHHTGSNPSGDAFVTERPVLDILFSKNLNLNDRKIKSAVRRWNRRKPSESSNKILLDDIGRILAEKEKDIIGNPSDLVVTNNPTPLLDTGELRDNVAHRDTLNKQIRKP